MQEDRIENLFKPDPVIDEQYRKQLISFLEHGSSKSALIDMGPLPPIYNTLGISDKQLKTSGKTFLKALGLKGPNRHHVPMETMENLLFLTYDPEAVFKSLPTSQDPKAFIAVLGAKASNQKQIIAILSPSHKGQGFTFIPSVYERNKFEQFIAKTHSENHILYIKNKGSELWGQLQLLPRHNSEPYMNRILTKNDVVKRFYENIFIKENNMSDMQFGDLPYEIGSPEHREKQLEALEKDSLRTAIRNGALKDTEFNRLTAAELREQGKYPLPERRNNNVKENSMSDVNEDLAEDKNLSPRELAFQNAVYQRNMIGAAIKNGTLCCLPGKDGFADTTPAVNLANHNVYHGDTQLYLKDHQKKNGFPTAEYLTQAQIEKAREDMPGLMLLKGQKGVSIHVSERNDETGEWDEKHIRLFNIAQLNSPKNFKKWVDNKRLEYFQSQHGAKIQPPEPGQKAKGPEIVCSSSDPVKYLGQYFAAVSTGRPFKADKETAQEFSKNLGDAIYKKSLTSPKTGDAVTDPFSLSKICREASKYCKEFMSELKQEQKQEQQQEQSQKRGSRKR